MKIKIVLHIISFLLFFLACSMLVPFFFSLFLHEADLAAWIHSILLTGLCAFILWSVTRCNDELSHKEGFLIVGLSWFVLSLFGSLPFIFSGTLPNPIDAFFETMSGFTTTGATVITMIDGLPHGILLWRSLTQWFGGMGIIVLSIAILPFLGVGGVQLFKAEVPGPQKDRLTPRITNTAKLLWGVYVLFSVLEITLLKMFGMTLFEAICHTCTTMSTGGFSTHNASVAGFNSPAIDWILISFMYIAGINFSLHFYALRGNIVRFFKDREFILYTLILLFASAFIFSDIHNFYDSGIAALRHAVFQVVSIGTTTGYCTQDFDLWPSMSRMLLLILMFVGGCSGSTGGGMKVVRILILMKQAMAEFKRLIFPRSVVPVRIRYDYIPHEMVTNIQVFFMTYVALFVIGSIIMAAIGMDFITALSSVAATLGNIGPGLGLVGATQNYAWIPPFGKVVLSLCMLIGRLELFTILILFVPQFWRN